MSFIENGIYQYKNPKDGRIVRLSSNIPKKQSRWSSPIYIEYIIGQCNVSGEKDNACGQAHIDNYLTYLGTEIDTEILKLLYE